MSEATATTPNGHDPRILAKASFKATFDAPPATVDVTDWLFHIAEADYNGCTPASKAHMSAAFTHNAAGRDVSINVETIDGILMLHHYVGDVTGKLHCRVASVTDLLIGGEFTTVKPVWELIVTPVSGDRHELTNNITVYSTGKYDAYLASHDTSFEEASRTFQKAVEAHGAEETPYFATSIGKRASAASARP